MAAADGDLSPLRTITPAVAVVLSPQSIVAEKSLSVPVELRPMGDETSDPQFRACLARWLARIWADKDREIDAILQGPG